MPRGVQPSPALMVSSNTSISECVRKMRDHAVGSLLVMSYSDPEKLVGIFTERDLLKWIDELQHGDHWEKPVAHLMSKPVTAISVTELESAAEMMIRGRFRHLPVTTTDGGVKRIIGVISMRDLLAEFVRGRTLQNPEVKPLKNPRALFLASDSEGDEIRRMLSIGGKMIVSRQELTDSSSMQSYESSEILIIDLDGVAPSIWAGFLKKFKLSEIRPPAVVFFDPRRHDEKHAELLRKLIEPGKLEVFSKPLNVIGFLSKIRELAGA